MTKWQLIAALMGKDWGSKITIKGITGILQSVQREDGSGNSFNLTILTDQGMKTVHLWTED